MKLIRNLLVALGALAVGTIFLLRTPQAADALFDRALERNFSDRAASLLNADGLSVFFCGTGSPLPSQKRAQTCTAIFAGGRFFLVDAGTGSWETVQAAGIPGDRLSGVFLTHFHSDHIGDLGEANLGSWVAGRKGRLHVYGPKGVERVVNGLNEAYALDNIYRTEHHGPEVANPDDAGLAFLYYDGPGVEVVYEHDGLKVTAFPVRHDPVTPAVGYRFDYKGRSVVVSGDTAYSPSLVEAANGADVLIHEAQANHMVEKMHDAALSAGNTRLAKILSDIPSYHTTPVEAATAANEAGVNYLALTHLTPAPDNPIAKRLFMRGVSAVRKDHVILAEDAMKIFLSEDGAIKIESR